MHHAPAMQSCYAAVSMGTAFAPCTMQHEHVQVRKRGRGKKNCDFFLDVIFANGMQLKSNIFCGVFFCGTTTPCSWD